MSVQVIAALCTVPTLWVECSVERAVVDAVGALLFLGERGVDVVVEIAVQRRGPRSLDLSS